MDHMTLILYARLHAQLAIGLQYRDDSKKKWDSGTQHPLSGRSRLKRDSWDVWNVWNQPRTSNVLAMSDTRARLVSFSRGGS